MVFSIDFMRVLELRSKHSDLSAAHGYAGHELEEDPAATLNPSSGVVLLMQLLCVTALGISGYLSWVAATASKLAGCGGDLFDCSHVLTSRWSTVFGIPVGVPAVVVYIVSMIGLIVIQRSRCSQRIRIAWRIVSVAGMSAGLAAIWFVSLQVFLIGHLCPWCLTAHACGFTLGGLLLWMQPAGRHLTRRLAGLSAIALGSLINAQLLSSPPTTYHIDRHPKLLPAGENYGDEDLFQAPGDEPEPSVAPTPSISTEEAKNDLRWNCEKRTVCLCTHISLRVRWLFHGS